jgi:hypothetical protein
LLPTVHDSGGLLAAVVFLSVQTGGGVLDLEAPLFHLEVPLVNLQTRVLNSRAPALKLEVSLLILDART